MQAPTGRAASGRKPTVVMIHGMWSTPEVWAEFASYFEQLGFTVTTPALRHHDAGASQAQLEAIGASSLANHVEDLSQFIANIGEAPVLIGHSMGGLIAQQLASRGLASAIVLLAPATPPGISSLQLPTMRLFYRPLIRRRFWERAHIPKRSAAAQALFQLLPAAERERRIAALVPDSGRALFEIALWWLDRSRAARIDYERVRCPVLIVAGSQDRATPAAGARHLRARYGERATYIELADHAHWLIGEPGWEKVARVSANWIGTVMTQRDGD
jgi:non-heme chloroperoxidase